MCWLNGPRGRPIFLFIFIFIALDNGEHNLIGYSRTMNFITSEIVENASRSVKCIIVLSVLNFHEHLLLCSATLFYQTSKQYFLLVTLSAYRVRVLFSMIWVSIYTFLKLNTAFYHWKAVLKHCATCKIGSSVPTQEVDSSYVSLTVPPLSGIVLMMIFEESGLHFEDLFPFVSVNALAKSLFTSWGLASEDNDWGRKRRRQGLCVYST